MMTKFQSIIIIEIIIILSTLVGCIENNNENNEYESIIINSALYKNAKRDAFTFGSFETNNSIALTGDILTLFVQYSGGCEEHDFKLIGNGTFIDIMPTEPVQTSIVLSHNANNDSCEAFISKIFSYDLKPLKELWKTIYKDKSGVIVISLEVYDESIIYSFENKN